jgi:hypothetical protein
MDAGRQIDTTLPVCNVVLDEPPGRMMPLGRDHVVAFYRHPRLISLRTGRVLHSFSDLPTGLQAGPIARGITERLPPIALDTDHHRFAVAVDKAITVVTFDLAALSRAETSLSRY